MLQPGPPRLSKMRSYPCSVSNLYSDVSPSSDAGTRSRRPFLDIDDAWACGIIVFTSPV